MDLKILTNQIRKRGLSETQTRLSIIRAYLIEYYRYSDLNWLVYEIEKQEGVTTSIVHLQSMASDMGIRRASSAEAAVYNKTVVLFSNGVCGFADHCFRDHAGKERLADGLYVCVCDSCISCMNLCVYVCVIIS